MDLWSKGLGRLVLTMRLSERDEEMGIENQDLVMKGTMGQPTYWDWSVKVGEEDVVDFLIFLRQPDPVRYMVQSGQRGAMLKAALRGAILFALRTVRYTLFGLPKTNEGSERATEINQIEAANGCLGEENR